jgi:hypothetical protein
VLYKVGCNVIAGISFFFVVPFALTQKEPKGQGKPIAPRVFRASAQVT